MCGWDCPRCGRYGGFGPGRLLNENLEPVKVITWQCRSCGHTEERPAVYGRAIPDRKDEGEE